MRIRLNAYGASNSVNLLTSEIHSAMALAEFQIARLSRDLRRSLFRGRADDFIFNYGSSREIPANVVGTASLVNAPARVNLAANKVTALNTMSAAGVNTITFTTDPEIATMWFNAGDKVFGRTELRGHSGEGVVVMAQQTPTDLGNVEYSNQMLLDCPLYTKGVRGNYREYRFHVFDGRIIFTQQKRRANGYRENPNYSNVVRNHGNGWIYANDNITTPNEAATTQALAAVNALGLTFGAVDIITKGDDAWVLEVNTAPGLQGDTTLRSYVEAIQSFVENHTNGYTDPDPEPYPQTMQIEAETTNTGTGELDLLTPTPVTFAENRLSPSQPVQLFQEGDRVELSHIGRENYVDEADNPHYEYGTITNIKDSSISEWRIHVEWDNEEHNNYREEDLVLAGASEQPQPEPEPVVTEPAPTHNPLYTTGHFYVIEVAGNRLVGEYCEINGGFWDTHLEMHYLSVVQVIREVTLD